MDLPRLRIATVTGRAARASSQRIRLDSYRKLGPIIIVAACLSCTESESRTATGGSLPTATTPTVSPAVRNPAAPPHPSAAEAFSGKLTADAIIYIEDDFVESYDPWDQAFAKLTGRLGPPTKIDGDTYYWAAVTNDICAVLEVEKIDGKQANMSGTLLRTSDPRGLRPLHYGPPDALTNRDQCLELAGQP